MVTSLQRVVPSADLAVDRNATIERIEIHDPAALAELLVLIAVRGRASLILLCPVDGEYQLELLQGSRSIVTQRLGAGLGNATVARCAALALIDLKAVASAAQGRAFLGRMRAVIEGGEGGEGELLASIGATPRGLELELRPIAVDGRGAVESERGHLKRCPTCNAYASWRTARCETDSTVLAALVDRAEPGGTIGSYIVGEILGQGTNGTVFAAEHALIGSQVAIKLNRDSFAASPSRSHLFLREARAMSRIRHASVVSIVDYGQIPDGRAYLVMERLDGESLEERLEEGGALSPVAALRYARAIAGALAAAHDCGVVHLDLKPSNVILLAGSTDLEPHVKLIDFGSALGSGDETRDIHSRVSGTPEYMSPERAVGEPADRRSDVYALGVLLYEMLSDNVPFRGDTSRDILLQHLRLPPPAVTSPRGVLAPAVKAVVARALRKKVVERQQTMSELIEEIDVALLSHAQVAS